jgi:transposase-like protein
MLPWARAVQLRLTTYQTIVELGSNSTGHRTSAQAAKLLQPRYAKVAKLLRDAEADILFQLAFPSEHWRSIRSTNVLERVNAEIDRRAKVAGIFPDAASLLRLSTAIPQDPHGEWQDGRCHYSQQSMADWTPAPMPGSPTPSRWAGCLMDLPLRPPAVTRLRGT